jgi:GLTT repeat (6 copies)
MLLSGRTFVAALLVGSTLGCSTPSLPEEEQLIQLNQEVLTDDEMSASGLATNGLATNGLATNGLATNGLATNGLATNGLESSTFSSWFSADPAQRDMLMRYLIGCALPQGEVRSYTDPDTGKTYTWYGKQGLAPRWGSGEAATEVEEQVISACLAAHANPYGLRVDFSLLGLNSEGIEISYTEEELLDYSVPEACFFGNLFRDQGLYAANDSTQLASSESTNRGCGLSSIASGTNPVCPEILRVGTCDDSLCEKDATGTYYTQCTYNGVVYRPMTSRLKPAYIYTCGDGICQVSEKCGEGWTPDNCSDCGACSDSETATR